MEANTTYTVKSAGEVLGQFETNALGGKNEGEGNGSFRVKYTLTKPHPGDALEEGLRVNVWNEAGTIRLLRTVPI